MLLSTAPRVAAAPPVLATDPIPPCRDFSNGFLVAEVLSKYFPADISMHSFQNATSTAEKNLNWGLVAKFLATQGINLTDKTMNAVMSQDQAAVEKFLNQLYLCAPSPVCGSASLRCFPAAPRRDLGPSPTHTSARSTPFHSAGKCRFVTEHASATDLDSIAMQPPASTALPRAAGPAAAAQPAQPPPFAFGRAAPPAHGGAPIEPAELGHGNTEHGKAAPMLSAALATSLGGDGAAVAPPAGRDQAALLQVRARYSVLQQSQGLSTGLASSVSSSTTLLGVGALGPLPSAPGPAAAADALELQGWPLPMQRGTATAAAEEGHRCRKEQLQMQSDRSLRTAHPTIQA